MRGWPSSRLKMRGGMPGAAAVAVVLASFVAVALAATGDVVEESRFVQGLEGWSITVEGKGAADGQAQHERGMKRIKGGDTGNVAWYFTAPQKVGHTDDPKIGTPKPWLLSHSRCTASNG